MLKGKPKEEEGISATIKPLPFNADSNVDTGRRTRQNKLRKTALRNCAPKIGDLSLKWR